MRITKIRLHTLLAAVFLSLFLTAITAFAGQHQSAESHPLRQIEISGIAIATPSGKISDILEAQGYTRVSGTMYTKQEQLQNQRKTIFRIEVEDTAAFREITYHRSLSGGRVSPRWRRPRRPRPPRSLRSPPRRGPGGCRRHSAGSRRAARSRRAGRSPAPGRRAGAAAP